jgi:hypothetical protein
MFMGGIKMDKLLKAVDLARALGVSRSVVYLWLKQGLPYLEAPGVGRRFQLDQVKNWLRRFERSAVDRPETSRIDSKPVFDPIRGEVSASFPKGVYGNPGGVMMIAYHIPGPDEKKTKRVRESSGSHDPLKAAAIRRDRIRAAWIDSPPSLNREKYLKEAE